MLAVFNTANGSVIFGVAVARVNADCAKDVFARWFQDCGTAKHYVGDNLGIRKVVGVGADEKELRQAEMLGEDNVGDLAEGEDSTWGWVVSVVKHFILDRLGLGDGIAEHCLLEFFGKERNVVIKAKDGASE